MVRSIGAWFFDVDKQPEVGEEAYDKGAAILREFFLGELSNFDSPDLHPLGKKIIECCKDGGIDEAALRAAGVGQPRPRS